MNTNVNPAANRPPVRYVGGKWAMADWLIGFFPPHTHYVEPFCGGASVLFRKYPSEIETINDIDSDVVNFFRVLREQPAALIGALAAALQRVQGMVVLCGYRSVLYDELYPDWPRFEKQVATNGNDTATECVWVSPRAHHLRNLPIFAAVNS